MINQNASIIKYQSNPSKKIVLLKKDMENKISRQLWLLQTQQFYGNTLTFSWFIIANLAVLAAAMRWKKHSFHIHLFLALAAIGFTIGGTLHLMFTMPWIGDPQDPLLNKVHNVAGWGVVFGMIVQAITGIFARQVQKSQKYSAKASIWIKRSHRYISYLIIIFAKFDYYSVAFYHEYVYAKFYIYLLVDLLFIAAYIWIKLYWWKLSQQIIDAQIETLSTKKQNSFSNLIQQYKNQILRFFSLIGRQKFETPSISSSIQIYKSEKQIQLQKFVLFNDYVYDTKDFQGRHPGGEYIMSLMNKREIDRFMFGMYPAELTPNIKAFNHPNQSMQLCGQPIAKMLRTSPMKGFKGFFNAKVSSLKKTTQKGSTFILNLCPSKSSEINLQYQGFSDCSQIGQYFSLTITSAKGKQRVTRLYTTIWSQSALNISRMQSLFPGSSIFPSSSSPVSLQVLQKFVSQSIVPQTIASDRRIATSQNLNDQISLVIKKYNQGQLTPRLLVEQFMDEIIMSEPMGAGMKYGVIRQNGLVVFVTGGTGLLPFCDFVDLLFKRVKYLQNKHSAQELARNDPLIKEDLIKNRSFILYCAAENYLDLPALAMYQLNALSLSSLISFSCTFRLKDSQAFTKYYPSIKIQKDYFDVNIKKHISEDICQFYVCGPPAMNSSCAQLFKTFNIKPQLYHFM